MSLRFYTRLFFFSQLRGVNISTIVSSNSYPCGVYDIIHGSFGTQFYFPLERLFCVLTRTGCVRVLQIWGIFLYCQFIISNSLARFLSRHFSSSLDTLAESSPFGTFPDTDTLLTKYSYISGCSLPSLEPSTQFSFCWTRITRSFYCLPFGKLGVYCILHTLAVLWTGLGYQFRAFLYLSLFNPCGEVYTTHPRQIVVYSQ